MKKTTPADAPRRTSAKKMNLILAVICLASILLLTATGALTGYLIAVGTTPLYSASALILVQDGSTFNNDIGSSSLGGERVNTVDIESSKMLANTCVTLFETDPDMKSITSGADVTFSVVEDSYFIRVTATSPDPFSAANTANLAANKAPEVFKQYFGDAGKVDTVEEAMVPASPSSPNVKKSVGTGGLIAFGVSAAASAAAFLIANILRKNKKEKQPKEFDPQQTMRAE